MGEKRIDASREISGPFVAQVCERLSEGKVVRRSLPGGGRLHVDRPVPFLCVYRETGGEEVGQTAELVVGEASYLTAPGTSDVHPGLKALVTGIADVMVDTFGAFFLLEVWIAPEKEPGGGSPGVQAPTFRIVTPSLDPSDPTVRQLKVALSEIPLRPPPLDGDVEAGGVPRPPSFEALLEPSSGSGGERHCVGIEVQPVYRQARTGIPYPVLFETLHRGLSLALKRTAFHFSVTHTDHDPPHFHAMGRKTAVRAAADADKALTEISRAFEFLLQVTPVNSDRAKAAFLGGGGELDPQFDYRPLVVNVDLLKRKLYDLPLEKLEDPTLSHLLSASREELDRKVTMLGDRNTPRFLFGSLAVYGTVDSKLHADALRILDATSPSPGPSGDASDEADTTDDGPGGDSHEVNAAAFARMAREELDYYRERYPEMDSEVTIRDDVAGLQVSNGNLLIGRSFSVSERRARGLIQHEIGTHVVTCSNGLAQPLGQLATGLAGYEETQEGLAVTAEYLSDALTLPRLRVLAARVVTVRSLVDGATFVESFRRLTRDFGFSGSSAFTICMRIYRSGGLTKDVIYLRGLRDFLVYMGEGGDLEPLLLGKMCLDDVPVIEELRWRGYLEPPRLTPRFLDAPESEAAMGRLRGGLTIFDLLKEALA
ncbi:flavohemoglobin expression-modulating QEGLA motif protein [soil metagenome]